MPFNRPDLPTLISRIGADIESRLPGVDAKLRRTVLGVLSRSLAGAMHGIYGYLDFLALQLLPDTAGSEYLERWAAIWGEPRKAAASASGTVNFIGSNGAVIAAGTVLQRADGFEYTLDAAAAIAGGVAVGTVTAVTSGSDSNTAAGGALSLVNPIAGVNTAVSVGAGGVTGGSDAESDDNLRTRLLKRLRNPPHGGAAFDYELWALAVADVTRVWVLPNHLGDGTVGVAFVCDNLVPILPSAAKVLEVQDYLDLLRPVTAQVYAFAPMAVAVDFTIQLIPNTAAAQAAVLAELEDLLVREGQPEDGSGNGTVLLSHIREAISVSAGEADHVLVSPAANVTLSVGEMAVMGAITWQ